MLNRAFSAVFLLASLCLPLAVQAADVESEAIASDEDLWITGETEAGRALSLYRPNLLSTADGSFFLHGLPALTLLDGRRFPISTELGRMGRSPVVDFPSAFLSAVEVKKDTRALRHGSDSPVGAVDLRVKRFDYGGEVGFFYGRSDGKYGRKDMSAYILGGVGNEKFNVTVGASFTETEIRSPARRR